jgi:hypothetical protein
MKLMSDIHLGKVTLYFVLIVALIYAVVHYSHNRDYIYVSDADTLETPIFMREEFEDMKLYKVPQPYGDELHVLYDGTKGLSGRGTPHISPYIYNHYDSLPDTIYADGYYVKTAQQLTMMVELPGKNIRILSYRYKKNTR